MRKYKCDRCGTLDFCLEDDRLEEWDIVRVDGEARELCPHCNVAYDAMVEFREAEEDRFWENG